MELEKRDRVTGRMTTGHEWNGIEELETPIPRLVFYFLGATILFSVICWVLYPTWPLGSTFTKGLTGFDQRNLVTEQVARADAERAAAWAGKVEAMSYAEIEADPALMEPVREAGRTLFVDNCAACHGVNATGGPGFPNLTAKSWLWGGEPEAIEETIKVGINSTNDDTRVSQMMAFGRDGVLAAAQISDVVTYVRSLSGAEGDAARMEAGKEVFAANCVACHGDDAKGSHDVGAPDLTDHFWIYGGDTSSVYTSVYSGRQGHMPHWDTRLSPLQVKLLTLYVHTLDGAPN
ncbi:cytochrome C [Mesorhizobium sp. Root157]|uniref:cytochrome-c oxidase, cbb3-type subunit III n=1 Tax=Mesorhizobium sp. Root157 TaxID=1736477 RepID=UPI0006F2249B|nr:cytochrome-c oxidase, cbb3-type subunit III [Mesorhizobium sp. Root157]KQZ82838.1 cytochrome C [Mesorhizobium sp. Root157]